MICYNISSMKMIKPVKQFNLGNNTDATCMIADTSFHFAINMIRLLNFHYFLHKP